MMTDYEISWLHDVINGWVILHKNNILILIRNIQQIIKDIYLSTILYDSDVVHYDFVIR